LLPACYSLRYLSNDAVAAVIECAVYRYQAHLVVTHCHRCCYRTNAQRACGNLKEACLMLPYCASAAPASQDLPSGETRCTRHSPLYTIGSVPHEHQVTQPVHDNCTKAGRPPVAAVVSG
jgi:hypothetical protein